MSGKWTGNHCESGILRKSEPKEKKEELFVFGYSCKLFRNDDRALHIDQGKHLIPWMGDETLKIDRYDARGALHDLSRLEAPPGGYDWRVELTKSEQDVEQLCDEERYRALHTDEDEELMYKEEELKRLHAAGYGQVGFNYDTPAEPSPTAQPTEVDEPFVPAASFKLLFPIEIVFPETQKQNAIIEKTSKFIATQGAQMEILIKAKQRDNSQFKFLNKEDELHPYYMALTGLVKAGRWPEKAPEVIEEKPPEPDEYLHPSLASAVIESAPSIPSIHYKPSADCDYTMLISKMRGEGGEGSAYELAPGELPPPGTEPPLQVQAQALQVQQQQQQQQAQAQYSNTPVMYNTYAPAAAARAQPPATVQQYAAYYPQYLPQPPPPRGRPLAGNSTGLSLMKNYGSGSETENSDSEDSTSNDDKVQIAVPPEDVRLVVEKMSTYVARNGDEFADIVRAKNDTRFTFLDPEDVYHPYYDKLMREKRGEVNGSARKKTKPPVSFSIKKMKEPDPILPKPALPYESSSDEDSEKQTDKTEEPKVVQQLLPQSIAMFNTPPALVYKIQGELPQNFPMAAVKTVETTKQHVAKPVTVEIKEVPKPEIVVVETEIEESDNNVTNTELIPVKVSTEPPATVDIKLSKEVSVAKNHENDINKEANIVRESEKAREKESSPHRRDKKRQKERREHRSKSQSRERRSRSLDREKRREKARVRDKERKQIEKDVMESEIISLGDNSDDMIDLTGDLSDSKGEGETEAEKAKQQVRKRRAAEFLKKVGVDPTAIGLPTNSLASAMVDTLESIRKKKEAEEAKRRRKEKRRRREKRDYEESERSHRKSKRRRYKSSEERDESDYESSKKKKRKKDKKTSKKKKKRYEPDVKEEIKKDQLLPPHMDLSSTLKELRTNSPTKNLIIPDIEENIAEETSSEEDKDSRVVRKRKTTREYSEGEWSSDSDADSTTSEDRNRMAE